MALVRAATDAAEPEDYTMPRVGAGAVIIDSVSTFFVQGPSRQLGIQGQPQLRWCTRDPHKRKGGAAVPYAGDGSPKLHGRTAGPHEAQQHLSSGVAVCTFVLSLSLSLSLFLLVNVRYPFATSSS